MPKKKKSEVAVPAPKDYGTTYTEIYYREGEVPYNSGKKEKVTLLSGNIGRLKNGLKVELNINPKEHDGKWRFIR